MVKTGIFLQFSEHSDSTREFLEVDTERVVDIDFLARNKAREYSSLQDERLGRQKLYDLKKKYGLLLDYSRIYVCTYYRDR